MIKVLSLSAVSAGIICFWDKTTGNIMIENVVVTSFNTYGRNEIK